eukprot:8159111-Alexandrium_andersonii.AAC.1
MRAYAWSRSCPWESIRRAIWLITFVVSSATPADTRITLGAASGARAGGRGTCEAERLPLFARVTTCWLSTAS